jgi:hypothetical protein
MPRPHVRAEREGVQCGTRRLRRAGGPTWTRLRRGVPDGRGSEVGDDVGDVELCVEIGDPGHVDAPRNRVVIGELAAEDCIGEPGELGAVGRSHVVRPLAKLVNVWPTAGRWMGPPRARIARH